MKKMRSRSLSVTILAILQGLISFASFGSGLFLLLLISGAIQVWSHDLVGLSLYLKGLVVLGLAISLFGLVVTYGLWTLKFWGWTGSLIFQGLCIVNNGLAILAGQSMTAGVYFSTALCMAFIGALLMPNIRQELAAIAPKLDEGTP
jgi:hypothetical protein